MYAPGPVREITIEGSKPPARAADGGRGRGRAQGRGRGRGRPRKVPLGDCGEVDDVELTSTSLGAKAKTKPRSEPWS